MRLGVHGMPFPPTMAWLALVSCFLSHCQTSHVNGLFWGGLGVPSTHYHNGIGGDCLGHQWYHTRSHAACGLRAYTGVHFWQATSSRTALHGRARRNAETDSARKLSVQKRLGLTDSETEALVARGRSDIAQQTEETLLSKVDWLQEHLQVNQKTLKKIIMKTPMILNYNSETLDSKISWFQDQFNWTMQETASFMTRSTVLTLSIDDNLKPQLHWLRTTFNATNLQLSKAIRKNSQALVSQRIGALQEKLDWLETNLELNSTKEKRQIFFATKIPDLSIASFDSKFNYIQDRLSLTKNETAKVLRREPILLALSIKDNLEPTLLWFQDRLGDEGVKRVAMRYPRIFTSSIPNTIAPRMELLKTRFQLDNGAVAQMVCNQPSLLTSAPENLESKIQFYIDCVGSDIALPMIIKYPVLLNISLENRLIPRWNRVVELGLENEISLVNLGKHTNDQWEAHMRRILANR